MNSDGTINTVQIISRDITDLKEAEEAVKKSLEDKEMLLREIHHRVKNNMQIISSLLNLQRSYIQDPNTDSILQESQDRVKSMAMVHEKLYETPELSHINVDDYIRKLTQNLFLSYRVQSGINLEMNFDDIYISTDTAIPLGLLINELVSNSLKHAFVGRDHGTITISVSEIENGYQLMVGDNGWGIPEGFDYTQTDTLGLQLVNSLLDQINGTLFLETGKGTKFIIRFSELNYPKRH
jgi:two-component sensor histidine kinase